MGILIFLITGNAGLISSAVTFRLGYVGRVGCFSGSMPHALCVECIELRI